VRAGTVALLLALSGGPPNAEESFRCPSTAMVHLGDDTDSVIDKCGDPADRRVLPPVCGARGCRPQTEYWRYDFGSTQFLRYLVFVGKRLARIEVGDYGGRGRASFQEGP
jgi:hypothetical protein